MHDLTGGKTCNHELDENRVCRKCGNDIGRSERMFEKISRIAPDWAARFYWSCGVYDDLYGPKNELVYSDTDPLDGLRPWDSLIGNDFITRILHIGLAADSLGNILSAGTTAALVEENRRLLMQLGGPAVVTICDWHRASAMLGRLRATVVAAGDVYEGFEQRCNGKCRRLLGFASWCDWCRLKNESGRLQPGDLGER